MCYSADNSLESNLAALDEMLRKGTADLSDMPRLKMEAENAERMHQRLARDLNLNPAQLLLLTNYHLNLTADPLQITFS